MSTPHSVFCFSCGEKLRYPYKGFKEFQGKGERLELLFLCDCGQKTKIVWDGTIPESAKKMWSEIDINHTKDQELSSQQIGRNIKNAISFYDTLRDVVIRDWDLLNPKENTFGAMWMMSLFYRGTRWCLDKNPVTEEAFAEAIRIFIKGFFADNPLMSGEGVEKWRSGLISMFPRILKEMNE